MPMLGLMLISAAYALPAIASPLYARCDEDYRGGAVPDDILGRMSPAFYAGPRRAPKSLGRPLLRPFILLCWALRARAALSDAAFNDLIYGADAV